MSQQSTGAPPITSPGTRPAQASGAPAPTGTPTGTPTGPGARDPRLAAPAVPPRRGLRRVLRTTFTGTPGRMRLVAALVALAAAVFGVIGSQTLWTSSAALERADHNTTQVVRVQSIYADLLRADADATNAFLAGGLEKPVQRADYDASIGRVAQTIAEAAEAQPADGAALGALNQQFQTYTALVEQARAYNRQGLPVGATYLSNASAGLRSGALPIVTALNQANTARTAEEFDLSTRSIWLAVSGGVALLVLFGGLIWLARRTHRYLNVPVVVGVVLVLIALVVGATTVNQVANQISSVRSSTFTATLDLATIRSAAFDAKANESLTLIARGSGTAFETSWASQSKVVTDAITDLGGAEAVATQTTLSTQWAVYIKAHQAIRALDDGGEWQLAVNAAGATGAGSANAAFATFSDTATQALTVSAATTSDGVLAPRTVSTFAGWALLLICLVAAGLTLRGFGQRLEEYR